MDEDTTDAAWHQQQLEERQQIEEAWQAMCRACYADWMAQLKSLNNQGTKDNEIRSESHS